IDHVAKPDIVAPGNRIVSLLAPGSYLATTDPLLVVGTNYLRLSGTSMATPVVAGAAALMIQRDPTLTPDTVKARMMKTAWKGYPIHSWAYDAWGVGHFSQYDVFTIGAGYLDVYAALGSADVASGTALSPTATFNPASRTASLTLSTVTWSNSIAWGDSIVWSESIVWGIDAVDNSVILGNSVVWGDTAVAGNSIVWSDSIVWGITDDSALTFGEDGES